MRQRTLLSVVIAAVLLLGLVVPASLADSNAPQGPNPLASAPNGNSHSRYIVMLEDSVEPISASAGLAREHGLALGHVYQYALKGFSCSVPAEKLGALEADPRVKLVEPDLLVHTTAQPVPTGVDRIEADLNDTANINGLDERVDVDIAIIDTGIDIDHPDLNVVGGRHFYSTVFAGIFLIPHEDDNYDDDAGHGTHVAGIAAALDNGYGVVGVAPGARLWGVKVLDENGSGYLSDVAAGVDWVTENASEIEVANMSLAWTGDSVAVRTAISNSVSAGVVYVVAAGNDAKDIYGSDGQPYTNDDVQPAAYAEVATISAMVDTDGMPGGGGASTYWGDDDSFASFSNFSGHNTTLNPVSSPGLAIDLIMPGVDIYSTYKDGGYAQASGTSMASPHAAGLAALYIAANGRATSMLSVMNLRQALVDMGMPQSDVQSGLTLLNDPDGNEENIGWAGPSEPSPNNPPVADAGGPYSGNVGESITFSGSSSYDSDGTIASYEWDFGDGATGTGVSPTHIYTTAGTYMISLTVTDDDDATNTATTTATISPAPSLSVVHVGDIDASVALLGKSGNWSASVTVTVHDIFHQPVSGAVVQGIWGDGTTATGTTDTDGKVTISTGAIKKKINSITFEVTGITGDLAYEPADNHDPDGDSDGITITVGKP